MIPGTYRIEVTANGYLGLVVENLEVSGTGAVENRPVEILSASGGDAGSVSGTVKSATTFEAIEGVKVELRLNWESASGAEPVATVYTDASGYYCANLPRGYYTATYIKEGYTVAVENVLSCGISQDKELSPSLNEGEYRIILKWGETPSDLDSYLYGKTETSDEMFYIYYGRRTHMENGERVAWLDRDDVDSYGPETTTVVREVAPGSVYRYSVRDFTNRLNAESYAMSNSGAKVELYKGDNLLRTIHIPANVPGYVWNVFEINGDGRVTTINAINSDDTSMELQTAE